MPSKLNYRPPNYPTAYAVAQPRAWVLAPRLELLKVSDLAQKRHAVHSSAVFTGPHKAG